MLFAEFTFVTLFLTFKDSISKVFRLKEFSEVKLELGGESFVENML